MARALFEEVERSRWSAAGRFLLKGAVVGVAAPGVLSCCCSRGPEVICLAETWEGEAELTGEVKSTIDCGIGLPPDTPYPTARVRCSGVNDGGLDTEGTPWFRQW